MLNRLQHMITPWLGSVALFLAAATAGYGAFWLASTTATLGWVGPKDSVPDGLGQGMVAFFAASTLALALLNLALKRPPHAPLLWAGGMTMTFYLLVLLLLGGMQGGLWSGLSTGSERWLNGAIAVFSSLNIVLMRYLFGQATDTGASGSARQGAGHRARVALVVGSGLLLLCGLVPWSTGWPLLKTDAAREQAAVATFGATYIAAKNTLRTCPAFRAYTGESVELTVSPRRGSLTDRPNYAIGSYWFNYRGLSDSGQQSQGQVGISVTQSKAAPPSLNEPPISGNLAPTFTYGPISIFPQGDRHAIQIRCDGTPASHGISD